MQNKQYKLKNLQRVYRSHIEVWHNEKVTNELHETTVLPKLFLETWAEVVPQTGKVFKGPVNTLLASVTHKIILRYEAGKSITEDMYIIHEGKKFEIKYILNPYMNNETIEIFVEDIRE